MLSQTDLGDQKIIYHQKLPDDHQRVINHDSSLEESGTPASNEFKDFDNQSLHEH